MVRQARTKLGSTIKVPRGLKATGEYCGHNLVTGGTETGVVMEGEFFNGKFMAKTGGLAVFLDCPLDGDPVQFPLP